MSWTTNTTTDHPLIVCDPCTPAAPGTYTIALAVLGVLAVPVPGATAWILASSPFTEKTDLLSFNLIVTDFLLCLSTALTVVGILLRLQLPHFIWSFLLCLITCGRPLFQCLICVERYLAVEHPQVFLRYRPPRYRLALLAAVWPALLLTGCGAVITCVTQNQNKPYLSFQCAVLLLIFTVNSSCCVCVLRALIRPPPGDGRLKDLKDRRKEKKSQSHQIKKKAFKLVSMIQIYLIVCYLPPLLIISFDRLVDKTEFCAVYLFHLCFVLLTSCFHCLFHLHSKGEFKQRTCSRQTSSPRR